MHELSHVRPYPTHIILLRPEAIVVTTGNVLSTVMYYVGILIQKLNRNSEFGVCAAFIWFLLHERIGNSLRHKYTGSYSFSIQNVPFLNWANPYFNFQDLVQYLFHLFLLFRAFLIEKKLWTLLTEVFLELDEKNCRRTVPTVYKCVRTMSYYIFAGIAGI